MRSLPSTLLCLTTLLLTACPGDDTTGEDGPVADSGATTVNDGTTTVNDDTTTAPGMTTTTEPGTGTGTGGTGTSTGSGETGPGGLGCGEAICAASEWCDWSDDACGEGASGMGTCEPFPEGCDDSYMPVCGCDGQVHSNVCYASMVGVDLAAEGDCKAPEGYFPCGYSFCSLETEYCQVQISDIGGFGDSYSCMQPAMECPGGITCDCLTEELCFDFGCNPSDGGGVEIVCPGG